jgi:hypothetical protein
MNNNEQKPSVGIRAWGTTPKKGNRFPDDDLPRLSWLKMRPGLNDLRIVTGIGTYYQVRWKGPKSKAQYGDRIRTSYPTYLDECPVKTELKLEPKERYIVVVIDRFDGELKIFDFGQIVLEQVETTIEAKNSHRKDGIKVSPRDFDISISFNPKSTTPSGYYGVVGQDYEPMSQEDLDLIKDVGGEDVLDKIIQKQLICPKPETVRKRLLDLGWDGKVAPDKLAKGEKVADKAYQEPSEDDYSFKRPSDSEEVSEEVSE